MAQAAHTQGLSRDDLICKLRVSPETVDGWMSGARQRPPYFDLAINAARTGLQPIAGALVPRYHRELGVAESLARYWETSGQVPVPARMAVAWIIHRRVTDRA